MDPHVATIEFTDGVRRPVYEGANGRQDVIDTDGEGDKVYGRWFIPPDDPQPTVIVAPGGCEAVEGAKGPIRTLSDMHMLLSDYERKVEDPTREGFIDWLATDIEIVWVDGREFGPAIPSDAAELGVLCRWAWEDAH